MRPPLIVLDFARGHARRYWPRQPAGFLTQTATLQKPANDPWLMGSPEGLELLEKFRKGDLHVEQPTEEEYA